MNMCTIKDKYEYSMNTSHFGYYFKEAKYARHKKTLKIYNWPELTNISLASLPIVKCNPNGNNADWIIIDDLVSPVAKSNPWTNGWVQQGATWFKQEEKGNNPMRAYNDNTAVATVHAPQSDTAVQRDYLLRRLSDITIGYGEKYQAFRKLFNLDIVVGPKTYKELIDAIKNGKYTLDEKITKRIDQDVADQDAEDDHDCFFGYGMTEGIIWDGVKPDYKGWETAREEFAKRKQAAKDTIMVSDATAGLKALQDFEAWMPTPATTTVQ